MNIVWIFPALVPLLTIILSFILQGWNWMPFEDLTILNAGTGIINKSWFYFLGVRGMGEFKPIYALHSGILYTIFESHANWFYIFKVLEILLVLLIWGILAYRITKKTLSVILIPVITLSFHYFYDAFFYLASHEIIGLLFLGIAVFFFLNNLEGILGCDFNSGKVSVKALGFKSWILGLFFLLCSYGSKETFTSSGIALGLSYIYLSLRSRKAGYFMSLLSLGASLIAVTFTYCFFLLSKVKSTYTSCYSLLNFPKIVSVIQDWVKKDFINHIPWIIGALFLFIFYRLIDRKTPKKQLSLKIEWGIVLAIMFYAGYLLILLPWNARAQYATPFGLLFSFLITLLVSDYLSNLNKRLQFFIIISALVLNQLVCQYALIRESTYQYDTYNLMKWISTNPLLKEDRQNYSIQSNACEPSFAIPVLTKRKWPDSNLIQISWSFHPQENLDGKKYNFYLYSPRFGTIDMSKIKGWEIVFLSKNWTMFKKSAI